MGRLGAHSTSAAVMLKDGSCSPCRDDDMIGCDLSGTAEQAVVAETGPATGVLLPAHPMAGRMMPGCIAKQSETDFGQPN